MQDFLFYMKLGWEHIVSWDALDHQLFILALVIVYSIKDWRKILILVTAFTIGHSVTLTLSVLEAVRIPTHWVEFLIPVTIVITAVDNLLMRNRPERLMRLNYALALIFGLVHGMGFANTARMAIAGAQTITIPLLGFNIGLELGQILVVAIIMGLSFLLTDVLRLRKPVLTLAASAVIMVLSVKMVFERLPF